MKFDSHSKVKRLGVFVFFEKTGHAYDYVKYILNDIICNLQELYIISNGNVDFETFQYFSGITENVYVRENEGLDAAAIQRALTCYIGWDKLQNFDEIVLFNDTFYGPIFSFRTVFDTMNTRDVDFWGISAGYRAKDGWNAMQQGYIPDHIQTFFVAFRKELFCADDFKNYWLNYPCWKDFFDVVTRHELIFTEYFSEMGYKWDVFSDTALYKWDDVNKNYNLYAYSAFDMVRYLKFPFIKRKNFTESRITRLYMNNTKDLQDVIKYVEENTDYDVNLIYQDLINHNNVKTLYESLNMNYILSDEITIPDESSLNECLIAFQCSCLDGIDYFISNLKEVGLFCDIIILMSEKIDAKKLKKKLFENDIKYKKTKSIPANVQGIPALWLLYEEIKEYKYVCFLHDGAYYKENFPKPIFDSLLFTLRENTIKNKRLLYNAIKLLEKNNWLGLLEVPFALHNKYFHYLANYWENDFCNVKKMSDMLRLNCFLDENIAGISRGGAFVCKTVIFAEILNLKIVENDYKKEGLLNEYTPVQWEKILPYMAQHHKLLTGVIMSSEYAVIEISNLRFYFSDLLKRVYNLGNNSLESYGIFAEAVSYKLQLLEERANKKSIGDDKEVAYLRELLAEKDRRIRSLVPLTSLKTQIRLHLKKCLPSFAYKGVVVLKRLLLGPRDIPLIPEEEESYY